MGDTVHVDATDSAPGMLLRPWAGSDSSWLVEAYRDPVLRRWTRLHVDTDEDAARWLEVQRQGWETGERFSFAVLETVGGRDGGLLVGNVALKRTGTFGANAEVGYWTAAGARGRGAAPRALDALTAWAFETFADGVRQLDLLHQVDNPASCRVAEKSGYAYARTLPAHPPFPRDGHLHTRSAPWVT